MLQFIEGIEPIYIEYLVRSGPVCNTKIMMMMPDNTALKIGKKLNLHLTLKEKPQFTKCKHIVESRDPQGLKKVDPEVEVYFGPRFDVPFLNMKLKAKADIAF